jgi:glycerophosphoryl diester phosphodiesterase
MIDGKIVPHRARNGELVVARARALVLRELLLTGASIEQLRARDPGRQAVSQLLVSLDGFRNNEKAGDFGYGAIDGRAVPPVFIERFDVPRSECDVVIATDGYPKVMPSLDETEALLAQRLRADPLLIEEPPQTKGMNLSSRSFDDRAYLHLKV